ncbi:hypothetical protein ACQP2U_29695 [Nocardia sp. CA-084685]|uniref:hypothetical protein n=1 Tax=Nocardia sp. CA-084685 TaxID=3239970 RepID=UPI003D98643F
MGSDEQFGLDLGVPVEQTEWGKWVEPARRKEQVRKFLDRAGLRAIPAKPWPEGAPELTQLDGVVAELFPDLATAMAPENADIADAFICFLGECFIEFTGAEWIDAPWFGREYSFYDHVNPALQYGFADAEADTAWGLMKDVAGGNFSRTAGMLREFADRYAEERAERH